MALKGRIGPSRAFLTRLKGLIVPSRAFKALKGLIRPLSASKGLIRPLRAKGLITSCLWLASCHHCRSFVQQCQLAPVENQKAYTDRLPERDLADSNIWHCDGLKGAQGRAGRKALIRALKRHIRPLMAYKVCKGLMRLSRVN